MSEPVASGPPPGSVSTQAFRIGKWKVDPESNLLAAEGRGIRVEPRVMQVLLCLASRPGRPVSRDELMSVAWSDVIVGEDALNAAISKLRRLFDDDPRSPRFIETVPKVGYRLIAPVFREEAPAPSEAELPARKGRLPLAFAAVGIVVIAIAALVFAWRSATRNAGRDASAPSRMVPLTSDPGIEVEPAISPGNGDRVAYAWKGPAGDDWAIWVRTLASGQPLQLTAGEGSDHHPAWSPDAQWIAFVRTGGGSCAVLRVPALGGATERIAECSSPVYDLDWSSDGRLLAWSEPSNSGSPHRIVANDVETGRRFPLTTPDPRGLGDLAVAFEPGSDRFAFARSPALGIEEIWIGQVGSETPRQLTRMEGKIHGFDWGPGGELVVSSNRGGLFALWSIPANGGGPAWITGGPSDVDAPSVSADGKSIVFEQWSDEANLHALDLATGIRRALVQSSRWDWDPSFSMDGSRMAFVSDRSGSPELWTANAEGSDPSKLTSFSGPYLSRPRWSPDGRTIVFDSRAGGSADIWIADAAGGAPRRVTADPAQDLAPFWSSEGTRILFGSNRGGTWSIWSVAPDGSDAREEVGGGFKGEAAEQGVLFTRRSEPGLWLAQGDGTARRVAEDLAPLDASNWTVHGGFVYYVRRETPDSPRLVRLALDSGESKEVASLESLLRHSSIAVAPSGSPIVFSRVDRLEADLVVLQR